MNITAPAVTQEKTVTRRSFVGNCIVGGISAAVAGSGVGLPPVRSETAFVPTVGNEPELKAEPGTEADFIDRRWVEHTYFLTRKVSQPERFSNEPVIADTGPRPVSAVESKKSGADIDREDEGTPRVNTARDKDPGFGANPASAMGTVQPTKEGLVMWYVSPHRIEEPSGKLIRYDKVVRYAVSTDGRHFTQPKLGLVSFRGTRENNIVVGMNQVDAHGVPLSGPTGCSGFCVLDATRQAVPHARGRYTALFGTTVPKRGSGLSLAWSDDGLHWNAYAENPLTPSSDTYCNFLYDPRSKRYAIYIRPTSRPDGRRAGPAGVRSLLSRIESCLLYTSPSPRD